MTVEERHIAIKLPPETGVVGLSVFGMRVHVLEGTVIRSLEHRGEAS